MGFEPTTPRDLVGCSNHLSYWRLTIKSYEHACLAFTFHVSFHVESRALLNILRCRHFGGLYMQGRFFL